MVKYSVPVRFIGRKVRVSLRANEVVVFDGRTPIAAHPRIAARTGTSVQLDHYLEVLKIKPGAFPGSSALAAARATGTFTSAHEAFWAAARRVNGDAMRHPRTHRRPAAAPQHDRTDVVAGIAAALKVGAVSADVVALEARRHAGTGGANSGRHLPAHTVAPEHRVVSLTQRRLADPAAVIAGLLSRYPAFAQRRGLRRTAGAARQLWQHFTHHQPAQRREPRVMSRTTTVTTTLRKQRGLTEPAALAAIDQACRRLRLPTIRAVLDEALAAANREQLSYQGFLAELLLAECDDRDRRSTIRRVKAAGFPRQKWLGDFDFDANPNINPATIHQLATGDWISKGQPLCLIGDSGTGKSHLLIALGTAARRTRFPRPLHPGDPVGERARRGRR
ncbi:hypothetical protein MAGR_17750 [Mycolicibacterium agri]|uniref:Transposase n=1 Tax=Mycolicibacterium agri TaxID=36811 RepID=A0A7I9VY00_MYCAG|nr:hypothetical protein MAGR_17750 [Mycolicibacterium agri]